MSHVIAAIALALRQNATTIDDLRSRWQAQLGFRLKF
jgi:hypothetical protein